MTGCSQICPHDGMGCPYDDCVRGDIWKTFWCHKREYRRSKKMPGSYQRGVSTKQSVEGQELEITEKLIGQITRLFIEEARKMGYTMMKDPLLQPPWDGVPRRPK